jgi:hypothetical protein
MNISVLSKWLFALMDYFPIEEVLRELMKSGGQVCRKN